MNDQPAACIVAERMKSARELINAALSLRETAHAYLRDGEVKDARRCYDTARWALRKARRLRP